uniref:Uncharacterized protein n=1 Tax=Oryza barthii TaxID=65489 RepID=A0A0D3HJX4_9ORYZ
MVGTCDSICIGFRRGGNQEETSVPIIIVDDSRLACCDPHHRCRPCPPHQQIQVLGQGVREGSGRPWRRRRRGEGERVAGFHIPPASLQAIPYLVLIALVPAYEACFVPAMRRATGVDTGITPLQRIGVGLFAVTFSMVAAALVEAHRRRHAGLLSIFWIAPQFLVFGVSEMFTAVGLIEFFYKQSLSGMQAFLTSMTYCSYSFGFYLSSLLVSLVNKVTSGDVAGGGGWLSDNDLNKDRLDLFYWLLAGLSLLNFFNYLFWSRWYSKSVETTVQVAGVGEEGGGGEQQEEKSVDEVNMGH